MTVSATGRLRAIAVVWAVGVAFAFAATARADFTAATLISGTQLLQFDEADTPALSADGHYAVFQGSLAGVPGIYRRDLQTGQVILVAGGDASAP
jgi:hypothetical protein